MLTLVILCAFAVMVGVLTSRQIRSDFDRDTANAADTLAKGALVKADPAHGRYSYVGSADLEDFAAAQNADVRILDFSGNPIAETNDQLDFPISLPRSADASGYRVESREIRVLPGLGRAILQYARPLSDLQHTLARVRLLLGAGVLGGALFALLAGLTLARRAMAPIAELTATAREIRRTRDPSLRVPEPEADDEVAELARTLDGMLSALEDAQAETEHALGRQREFVADASHELRTPLTSLLANLELLHEELEGEPRETVAAALRSSRRMKRLVADLLMLARADTGQHSARRPVDLGGILVEAASEVEPLAQAAGHRLSVAAAPVTVDGSRDDLVRAALNLLENAVSHTPAGTRIDAAVAREGEDAVLSVSDAGPGVPDELEQRIFERFVRGAGDGGGGTGLGLAIVQAVAQGHGGSVSLERPEGGGARFIVRLPAVPAATLAADPASAQAG
ncbi:MAG: HAMP domain-containing sensor histidine kinase [Solirubrobacteraceae bacterium]